MQLFVYGSLLRGMSLSSNMRGAKFIGPAYVYADLFFLGFYPGIIPGQQIVFGELYEVNDKILPGIDKVEDYYKHDLANSIYLRKPIHAYLFSDGEKIEAYAYYYNRESIDKPRIACGDYRRFMHMQKSDKMWLISYGTNMHSELMKVRLGEVPEHKVVNVKGFESIFNVKTGINGFARPNLCYTGSSKKLKFVAWHLTEEQFKILDIEENVPNLYYRVSMPFIDKNGEFVPAQTYIANTTRLGQNLHPEPHYLDIQNKGMREHGIL